MPCLFLPVARLSMPFPAHHQHCYQQAPCTADPFRSGQAVAAAADDNDEDEGDSGGSSGFTQKELRQRCPFLGFQATWVPFAMQSPAHYVPSM